MTGNFDTRNDSYSATENRPHFEVASPSTIQANLTADHTDVMSNLSFQPTIIIYPGSSRRVGPGDFSMPIPVFENSIQSKIKEKGGSLTLLVSQTSNRVRDLPHRLTIPQRRKRESLLVTELIYRTRVDRQKRVEGNNAFGRKGNLRCTQG